MMTAFISPPRRISFFLKIGIWIAQKITKKEMLPAKLLAWYPKAALSSGILESLVAHNDKAISTRMLKLIRMQTSFIVSCPFCIDMNSSEYIRYGITEKEILALQGFVSLEIVTTFTQKEKIALNYTKAMSGTPLSFPSILIDELKEHFSEREIVIIVTTVAQVNYWARLIQALGIPPEGFTEACSVIDLKQYTTIKK